LCECKTGLKISTCNDCNSAVPANYIQPPDGEWLSNVFLAWEKFAIHQPKTRWVIEVGYFAYRAKDAYCFTLAECKGALLKAIK
jgi:hypothetical protein